MTTKWESNLVKEGIVYAKHCYFDGGGRLVNLQFIVDHFLDRQGDCTGLVTAPEGLLAYVYIVFYKSKLKHLQDTFVSPDTLYKMRLRWRDEKGIKNDCRSYGSQPDRDMHDKPKRKR